jgi:hypothetical protein
MYIITVATKPNPMLDLLTQQVKDGGGTLIPLGLELNKTIGWEASGNLGLKLKLVNDFLNERNPEDIVLFMDAYDVVFKGNVKDILERYATFGKQLVFGAEIVCSPSEFNSKYPEHTKNYPFRFLNSGLFIGTVSTLRECFQNYVYVDGINDQAWWKQKFLDRPDLIELDYNNILFLNCCNVNKHDIHLENKIQYKDKNPLFLHFNGPSKAIMNRYAKLDPNPYFTLFPHVSMEYYLAQGGE